MSASHTVEQSEAGLRCDVLIARLAGASRSVVTDAIRSGRVLRNGAEPRPSAPLLEGDVLEYDVVPPAPPIAVPLAYPLDILFEDETLLVVNKPAGMTTHPAHGVHEGTLADALLAHAGALPGDPLRPGLVHRLDRDTSGLLVVAKTPEALTALGKAMMRRFIEREYLGLVHGIPEHAEGTVVGAIGRDPQQRFKYAVRTDGKPATTHYAVRERLVRASELVFRLETGRTHQIRVHMAAFGHPIVADPTYGRPDQRVKLDGQALHAWRLRFRHPVTREDLAFEVEPPEAYVLAREALRH
jgi:23S rRNA pseudouridine1911/1915/1917 synthase